MAVRILVGDARDMLATLPAGSIDLTVTSPPYDNLRVYHGYSFDFEVIARELYRVTKPGGVVVWIVADATVKGSETGTSFRQALHFRDVCGFNLHDTMIYQKRGTGACGSTRAYWQGFEYMLVLRKGGGGVFNPIEDVPNGHAGVVKRGRAGRRTAGGAVRLEERLPGKAFSRRTNVWTYGVGGDAKRDRTLMAHPATFPEALARDHILSWSNPGDTVLDPFMGSGTTGKMAALNGRDFIGIDISSDYAELARRRLEAAGLTVAVELPAMLEAAD